MADDFKTFFKQAIRCIPFPYQCRPADPAINLPELLRVPTGMRKTAAAVLSWLWRREKRHSDTPRKVVDCAMTVVERVCERALASGDSRWSSHEGSPKSLRQAFSGYRPDSSIARCLQSARFVVSRHAGVATAGSSRALRTCAYT
jgi:hypothetical protein